ncbi:hypothetical protein LR48_Vigan02g143000 [Vigna angularis]|uniref:Uncharacterized protein n=1 Tax=Phaseolus angularis TaxID=3914 RepID=A0A0L9TXK6_PHAAN|nr:hypothetical protein LR48_Vigan02g143000 [Vigna angularis]
MPDRNRTCGYAHFIIFLLAFALRGIAFPVFLVSLGSVVAPSPFASSLVRKA